LLIPSHFSLNLKAKIVDAWYGTRGSIPSFLLNILTFHNVHDMIINDEIMLFELWMIMVFLI